MSPACWLSWTCLVLTSESSSLDKSFLTSFSWRDLTTTNWKLLSWKPPYAFGIPVQWTPHVLGIPVDVTPPPLQNSSRRNPPSPSEFRDAARGMGMDIFWNHPFVFSTWQKMLEKCPTTQTSVKITVTLCHAMMVAYLMQRISTLIFR